MTVGILIGVLAVIVSIEYGIIAVYVVPRLAGLAQTQGRAVAVAQWGAAAFFVGCAFTHAGIAVANLLPDSVLAMADMGGLSSTPVELVVMVAAHVAQIIGGGLFIGITRSRLEVSIQSKASAEDQRALGRQWRSAFNDAPLGIALLPMRGAGGGGDAYVNAAYLAMFGPGDGEGPSYPSSALRPDEQAQAEAAMSRLASGESVEQELHLDTDGATRVIRATLNPVADDGSGWRRVTGIFEDVTERTRAAAELRSREERFRQLAEGLRVGVNLRQVDPPQFLYANSEYFTIVGLSGLDSLEQAQQTLLDRIHPDDREIFLTQYWGAVQRGTSVTVEGRLLSPDGDVRWVRVASSPIAGNQVATTIEDITVTKNAAAAVMSAKAEAERANLAKSEFLSRMSHELRTPLNAVIGFGQLLKLGTLTDKQEVAVTHILGGGRHLLGMIDDILDISRIETDQLELSIEPVRTDEVVSEAVALVQPMAADLGITIDVAPSADDVVTVVRADRRRLRQVLLNLLSNAVKYNRPGGQVWVTCTATDAAHVAIAVSDSGIGIREEDLDRLFTPFDRLGQQVTDIEGTGIGLALSRRLAAFMGGRLEVTSAHGVGSTFTVVLPVAVESPQPDDGSMSADVPGCGASSTSTVLYVEDNLPNVRLMQALVERRPGWELVHAAQGSLGWELATSLTLSLILLDLHLPDMNGIDLLRRLRADSRTHDVPVVVVSADANQHQIRRLLAAGADRYLTKPLDVVTALAVLDEHATSPTAGAADDH